MQKLFLSLLLYLSCTSRTICASKLNVPRVLLPIFNDFQTKFVLEATEGGCYKWTTTRSDIIQLTLLSENEELQCSSKVIVSTVTKEAARNIAVVLAEDVHTKQNLRCDVIVDVIHSLAVTTTTKELFMEEAPENFEVKAYDDQGNEFSTLELIEFDWNIIPLGPNKESVIRYITYRDSPYEIPPGIQPLEDENKKGYSILLEGVKSGSAKITVKLPYPEYKHVETSEVQLMIVANLLLTPAEVYVMPGETVPFKIFYINDGRLEEITIPNSQYYLEAEDTAIASSFKKSSNVTALKEGKTRIVLRDRNVDKNDPLLKLPAATFHVVQPEYIVLNVLPHKNWAILVGQHHDIVAEVYDGSDHKLYLGDAVKVHLEVTPEFYTGKQTVNGSWLTGYGVRSGIATVQAVLKTSADGLNEFKPPIAAKAELMIYPAITIEPSDIILPWDPVTRPKYDIDLVAKGGDGRFLWSSSDNSIGIVSQSGHVRTHSNGFFEVSAVMMRNHHNRQSAKFMILPPTRLEIVEFVMEAEIGSPVYLHIALYAEDSHPDGTTTLVPFTSCQELPFQVRQSDVKFKQNKTAVLPPVGISCGNIAMIGLNVGTTKVTVTYFQDGKALEDSVTVSAYRPLQLLQPRKDVVIAVGSMINLVYTGGPRPLVGRNSEHQKVVVSEDETIATGQDVTQFHSIQGEDFTVIQVLCRKLGETDMKLMISNTPSSTGCQGQKSTVTTRVICGKPRKITLQPELEISDSHNCPMDLSSGNVVVQSTKVIDIDVTVWDDCGNRFLNFSSLNLEWRVTPFESGIVLSKDGIFAKNISLGTVPVADRSYQSFMPHIDVGPLEINVTVQGYNKAILSKNSVKAEWPEFLSPEDKDTELQPIKASLSLYLVEDTALSDSSLTLYNHPGNKKTVKVLQGSGFFEIALSADDVVEVTYLETTKELEITPMKSGEVIIQLLDLCLMSKPASLRVTVVSVGIIRVEMADKVEIGKCIPCTVRLYDENDNLMDIPDLKMVDLRPEFQETIANIQRADQTAKEPWGVGEIRYVITGVELGDTKLIFTAASNDEDVSSAPMDLQVFQPLKLHPRNGSVLIGASIQLVVKGGPLPDTEIVFAVTDEKTAKVSDKGIITGLTLGKTYISAKAIGVHPTTGQSMVFSEDKVEITVIALTGVKIGAPLTRFRVGATVPFWCFGLPDISPVILGTVNDPPINFRWLVDDKLLADLTGVYHPLGINIGRPDRVVLKLTGLQAGSTRVFVNVTIPGTVANKPNVHTLVYSAHVDIEIVSQFLLTQPSQVHGSALLMAPFSHVQLKTNMDSVTSISYSLPGEQVPSTELLVDKAVYNAADQIVTLTASGLLTSYGVLGHALLIITSVDANGLKQRINLVVEVKPIQYMSLNIHAAWRISFNHPIATLPLGTDFMLVASYHDNVGNRFHAGPTDLKVRTSRCDLIKVTSFPENGTIWISTRKEGHTMLKVWADGIQKTTDYVKVHVEQSVKPILDHLTMGDTVCLWSPVVSEFNTPGVWKSSDSKLVEINPALDIAFVGNKVGTVTLTHSLLMSAPIHLPIIPVYAIEFLTTPNFVLTNGDESDTRFVLVLQSQKSMGIKTNNLIQGWRCRADVRKLVRPQGFTCFMKFSNTSSIIQAEDLYNITNSWVPETGQYACKLVNNMYNNSDVALLQTNLTLWAVTDDGGVSSDMQTIKFLPGVYVEQILFLDEIRNSAELSVKGLPEVLDQMTVTPSDTTILFVTPLKSNEAFLKKYKVQLIDYHWRLADMEDAMGIAIISPITKQNLRVMVKVSGDFKGAQQCGLARSPLYTFLQNYKYAIVMAIAMIGIFLLTFYFYSTYMQPVVNVNVNPQRSATTSTTCAANRYMAQQQRYGANLSPVLRTSPNTSGQSTSQTPCKFNCSCRRHGGAREPVYGDPSSFYNSSSASPSCRSRRF
ncbi:nuclear pore membrane glycoprotein 210 [Anthonomus grandis grandis]|uniref:nuclear pore membrane glycoprotein 210 n=1 Tax=Anthonomus grandis grandis TaxID=2921223 RepID=UPI002165A462|nr:nuclear pore membrane glycoprotein 210 [Anthonomus grandis grandis]